MKIGVIFEATKNSGGGFFQSLSSAINLDKIKDWKNISELIPKFYFKKEMKKTGMAGIFAASLELTKEGIVHVSQEKVFDKLMIKKS